MLETILHSETAASVMGIAIFENGLHLREIARRALVSPPDAKRELGNLLAIGALRVEHRGNQTVFYTDEKCPFLQELRGLYLKTDGAVGILRKALVGVDGIKYAFVYGSFASGKYGERSDIDIMVAGNVADSELSEAVFKAQKLAEREINYTLWSEDEIKKKLAEHSAFIKSVVKGKKIWLRGDEHEFAGLAGKKNN